MAQVKQVFGDTLKFAGLNVLIIFVALWQYFSTGKLDPAMLGLMVFFYLFSLLVMCAAALAVDMVGK